MVMVDRGARAAHCGEGVHVSGSHRCCPPGALPPAPPTGGGPARGVEHAPAVAGASLPPCHPRSPTRRAGVSGRVRPVCRDGGGAAPCWGGFQLTRGGPSVAGGCYERGLGGGGCGAGRAGVGEGPPVGVGRRAGGGGGLRVPLHTPAPPAAEGGSGSAGGWEGRKAGELGGVLGGGWRLGGVGRGGGAGEWQSGRGGRRGGGTAGLQRRCQAR